MARAKQPDRKQAELTSEQMRAAIPVLEKRIAELDAVDVDTIQKRGESRFDALEQKYDASLVDIFGADTIEYRRYQLFALDRASLNVFHEMPLHEIRDGYRQGIEDAISNLRTIKELFQEKLDGLGESPELKAVRAFGDLDLHPQIGQASATLYRDCHYANAIEDACKALDLLVKIRSGKYEFSGTDLMQKAGRCRR